jgi:hypothetical protein
MEEKLIDQKMHLIRQTLARWGSLEASDSTAAMFRKLGVETLKVEIAAARINLVRTRLGSDHKMPFITIT